jgi:hypothetical protein
MRATFGLLASDLYLFPVLLGAFSVVAVVVGLRQGGAF